MNLGKALAKTRSGATLRTWLKEAGVPEERVHKLNTYDSVGRQNFPTSKIKKDAQGGKWTELVRRTPVLVTLGKVAEVAITETVKTHFKDKNFLHFHLPHPSGLNRTLNDPQNRAKCVELLKVAYQKLLDLEGPKKLSCDMTVSDLNKFLASTDPSVEVYLEVDGVQVRATSVEDLSVGKIVLKGQSCLKTSTSSSQTTETT